MTRPITISLVDYEGPIVTLEEAKEKGLNRFFTGRRCKRGHLSERYLGGQCIVCDHEYLKEYFLRPEIREAWKQYRSLPEMRERQKRADVKWRLKPENQAKIKEYLSRSDVKQRERENERKRLAKPEVRKRQNEKARENYYRPEVWAREKQYRTTKMKDFRRIQVIKYRTRLAGNGGDITLGEYKAILDRQGHRCNNYYCQADISSGKDHMDHIIPVTAGGASDKSNIQGLCKACNIRKSNRRWADFLDQEYLSSGF